MIPASSCQPRTALPRPRTSLNLPEKVASLVWRGDELCPSQGRVVPTGFAALDQELPGGGWPLGDVTELLQPQFLVTEAQLLLPAVAAQCTTQRQVLVIGPPQCPFMPGWRIYGVQETRVVLVHARAPAEALWATEQATRAQGVAAVLAWLPHARPEQMRRLQSCASGVDFPVFVMRPLDARLQASAAPLRVQARPAGPGQASVRILKRRGPAHDDELVLATAPARLAALLQHRRGTAQGPNGFVRPRRIVPDPHGAMAMAVPPKP